MHMIRAVTTVAEMAALGCVLAVTSALRDACASRLPARAALGCRRRRSRSACTAARTCWRPRVRGGVQCLGPLHRAADACAGSDLARYNEAGTVFAGFHYGAWLHPQRWGG